MRFDVKQGEGGLVDLEFLLQFLVLRDARGQPYGEDDQVLLESIAARAGVGVGTVYRHFPTKDALMGELMSDCMRDRITALTMFMSPVTSCTIGSSEGWARSEARR